MKTRYIEGFTTSICNFVVFILQDLDETYLQFTAHNESKNIFKAARTPAVFCALAVMFYILSGTFGLFGIYSLANICNLLMGFALLTLALWAYIR